jgi:hypothetical protein
MTLHTFKAGDRVRLARTVDRYPDFLAPQGMTGTVHTVEIDGSMAVQMDAPLEGAEDWDNCICWDDWQLDDLALDLEMAEG